MQRQRICIYVFVYFGGRDYVGTKTYAYVFGFKRPKSNFFAPKITANGCFRVKKNGTSYAQIQKRRPLFVANYPQN